MPVKHVRLSQDARNQLITLKRRTRIMQWNVLCRRGFRRSLAQASRPPAARIPAHGNVEMTWRTFGGHWADEPRALLRMRCPADGVPLDEETLATQFRLHLHCGIGYLAGDGRGTGIAGLASVALDGRPGSWQP